MPRDYSKSKGAGNGRYKTGLASAGKRSSLYTSWQNMLQRCSNPKHPKYHRYGGRGIAVCDDWKTIEGFTTWARANGWAEGLTIDRENNDKGYEPVNCRWITPAQNSNKKSTTKLSPEDAASIRDRAGAGVSLQVLAADDGVCPGTIRCVVNGLTHRPETMIGAQAQDEVPHVA